MCSRAISGLPQSQDTSVFQGIWEIKIPRVRLMSLNLIKLLPVHAGCQGSAPLASSAQVHWEVPWRAELRAAGS